MHCLLEEAEGAESPPQLDAELQRRLEALRAELTPLDFGAEVRARVATLMPGTRAWLLAEFDAWIASSEAPESDSLPAGADPSSERGGGAEGGSRAFVVLGGPGVGKTSFAALLCSARPAAVVAAHFCSSASAETRDVHRLLRSLAFQVIFTS